MSSVFFGKMNDREQVNSLTYKTEIESYLGEIKKGDFAFIKMQGESNPASVQRLWKLKETKEINGKYHAFFEEVCQFNPIELLKFEALNLFVLNVNLLNKCNKQTFGLSFIKLSLTDETVFEDMMTDIEKFKSYIGDINNYRTVVRRDSIDEVDSNSKDVQLYKDEDTWKLADDFAFIGDDLRNNFDSNQFNLFRNYGNRNKNTPKKQMFDFLSEGMGDCSLMGLWDLFCGSVNDFSENRVLKPRREEFIDYCIRNNAVKAAVVYESGIRSMEGRLGVNIDDEYDKDRCSTLISRLKDLSQYNLISSVKKYISYRDELRDNSDSSIRNDDSCDNNSVSEGKYDFSMARFYGINKVFYGTPGCGKSYYLDRIVLSQEGIDEESVFRTTFFQDYSNADFVGQILPKIDSKGSVTYAFTPGPFTVALEYAVKHPDRKVALIIEELNRGNAPSIFGDIFQLLDRCDGTSRYSVINYNVQKYLKDGTSYSYDYVKIPSNLFIFATMNTSDQNVFTLDTAFKRRWKFEKRPNGFSDMDAIGNKYVPGLQSVTWKTFVNKINEHIISHASSLSAEDKQLGKYFVEDELLLDSPDDYSDSICRDFAYKVLEYIWSDVAKFNRSEWFISEINSLDELIYRYVDDHSNVFVTELSKVLPIYTDEG